MTPDQPDRHPAETATEPALDPAIQEARAAPAAPADGAAVLDPLQKERDALLFLDASHPNHALFQQAVKGLEQLDAKRFKDRRELERIALAIAIQASAIGLTRVDRVALSDNGAGYCFVDLHAVDPALRGYVAHVEAMKPETASRALDAQRIQGQQLQEQRNDETRQQHVGQVQREVEQRGQERVLRQDRGSQDRAVQQDRAARDDRSADDRAASDRAAQDRASQDRATQDRAAQERAPRRL